MTRYDAAIIGAGQGGKPLALALAHAGQRVALIEREHVGGTCINVGCTPTKTMVASARVAHLSRRAPDYGISTGPIAIDMHRVRQRKNSVVTSFREGSERQIANAEGLTLVRGTATFEAPNILAVALNSGGYPVHIEAERIVINTGGSSAIPAIEGMREVPYLTSTTVMDLDEVPGHLIVLGGGYIGLEFGQMFRRFGSEVTIIHRGARVLAREDPDVADAITQILREEGITIIPDARSRRIGEEKDGVAVVVTRPSGEQVVRGSHLLVAAGRTPNSSDLHLANAGIRVDDRGFVMVNNALETSCRNVFAIGDVKGGPAFTHVSYDDFRVLKRRLIDGREASISHRLVPYTVFVDPQLGRVGITEEQAKTSGVDYKVATMPMSYVARAIERDETRGFMKVIVDVKNETILGCSVLGIEGGEIMAMMQIAMMGRMKYTELRDAIFAHPTLAESLNTLFAGL